MKLYHASSVAVEHPDVAHSRPNLDFGSGFYLTSMASRQYGMLKGLPDEESLLSLVSMSWTMNCRALR